MIRVTFSEKSEALAACELSGSKYNGYVIEIYLAEQEDNMSSGT